MGLHAEVLTGSCTGVVELGVATLHWDALRCLTLIHSWKLECLDSACSSTSAFFG